jgi:hypothetical protein
MQAAEPSPHLCCIDIQALFYRHVCSQLIFQLYVWLKVRHQHQRQNYPLWYQYQGQYQRQH